MKTLYYEDDQFMKANIEWVIDYCFPERWHQDERNLVRNANGCVGDGFVVLPMPDIKREDILDSLMMDWRRNSKPSKAQQFKTYVDTEAYLESETYIESVDDENDDEIAVTLAVTKWWRIMTQKVLEG